MRLLKVFLEIRYIYILRCCVPCCFNHASDEHLLFLVVVAGLKTSNGSLNAEPRIPVPVAAKSDAEGRSGIPADFPEHSEAGIGKTVTPPDMATEKKRGILSMFRRKKDSKEIKPAVVISSTRKFWQYL